MKKWLAKSAAYILLIFGILLVLACLIGAIAPFLYIDQLNPTKAWLVAIGCIVLAAIIGIITFAVFELLVEAGDNDGDFNPPKPLQESPPEPPVTEQK